MHRTVIAYVGRQSTNERCTVRITGQDGHDFVVDFDSGMLTGDVMYEDETILAVSTPCHTLYAGLNPTAPPAQRAIHVRRATQWSSIQFGDDHKR